MRLRSEHMDGISFLRHYPCTRILNVDGGFIFWQRSWDFTHTATFSLFHSSKLSIGSSQKNCHRGDCAILSFAPLLLMDCLFFPGLSALRKYRPNSKIRGISLSTFS